MSDHNDEDNDIAWAREEQRRDTWISIAVALVTLLVVIAFGLLVQL